MVEGSDPCPLQ
jgi:hypothetical protein